MNLKKNLQKRCIYMGVVFGIFYSAGMTFSLRDGDDLTFNLLYFAGMAVFSGVLYGYFMYLFLRRQQKVMLNHFPALAQKSIIAMQPTQRLSAEKPKIVSGGAYLTSDTLYYYVESKKYRAISLEIPLNQIAALQLDTFMNNECVKLSLSNNDVLHLRFGNANADWAIKLSNAIPSNTSV